MVSSIPEASQNSIGAFSDQQTAEQALQALQEAGFARERIALVAETPPVTSTEAKKSGIRGAIAGALSGGLAGLVLSLTKASLDTGVPAVNPFRNSLGLFLAGSFVGAIGMGIIGAMTGVNVRQANNGTEVTALIPGFVLFAKDLQPEELQRAREIVQRFGSDFQAIK
jgi:phosphoribosylcarboxyaminoimidazole (NCAIR) mutase